MMLLPYFTLQSAYLHTFYQLFIFIQMRTLSQYSAKQIRKKIKNDSKQIEQLLKKFYYSENKSHAQNMNRFISILQSKVLQPVNLGSFLQYLSNQDNIPLQVNFKNLKFGHFKLLIQDWLELCQDYQPKIAKAHLFNINNQLFNKILKQDNSILGKYFTKYNGQKEPCISELELYQLLIQLMSTKYFLYEYNDDEQTFFHKKDNYQNFINLLRMFQASNTHKQPDKIPKIQTNESIYIKKHQIQKFMDFWKNKNPELTLLQKEREKRKKKIQSFIQKSLEKITKVTFVQKGVQVSEYVDLSLLNIVNRTIRDLNRLIEKQIKSQMLVIVDRIFDCLWKQKINITRKSYQTSDTLVFQEEGIQQENQMQIFSRRANNYYMKNMASTLKPRQKSLNKPNISQQSQKIVQSKIKLSDHDQTLKKLYQYYCDKNNYLNLKQVNMFFQDIGLIRQGERHLIKNILLYRLIRDQNNISLIQFSKIIKSIMKEDFSFNFNLIEEFISVIQTPTFKEPSPKYNLFSRRQIYSRQSQIKGQQKQYQKKFIVNEQRNRFCQNEDFLLMSDRGRTKSPFINKRNLNIIDQQFQVNNDFILLSDRVEKKSLSNLKKDRNPRLSRIS